jgi:hypothetical protein
MPSRPRTGDISPAVIESPEPSVQTQGYPVIKLASAVEISSPGKDARSSRAQGWRARSVVFCGGVSGKMGRERVFLRTRARWAGGRCGTRGEDGKVGRSLEIWRVF